MRATESCCDKVRGWVRSRTQLAASNPFSPRMRQGEGQPTRWVHIDRADPGHGAARDRDRSDLSYAPGILPWPCARLRSTTPPLTDPIRSKPRRLRGCADGSLDRCTAKNLRARIG